MGSLILVFVILLNVFLRNVCLFVFDESIFKKCLLMSGLVNIDL